MLTWLKLSHPRHSGKLRAHEHTSYIPLGILLFVVGIILSAYTSYAVSPPPQSDSIGLSGSVPAKPPVVAATIKTPVNGQRFATTPVKVSGTCPKDTLVEVFKNEIFAGSTACSDTGTYELDIDLMIGENKLVARVYDALNQAGPDSNIVTVFYDALPAQSGSVGAFDFGGAQLLLNTEAVFRGAWPDKELKMPVRVIGGTPPYAINFQWGDSSNRMVPRGDNIEFTTAHAYKKPGTYQISLQATDASGRVAFLTVAAIVNGQPDIAAGTTSTPTSNNGTFSTLLALWPLYTASVAIVVSFWLGEIREKRLLIRNRAY